MNTAWKEAKITVSRIEILYMDGWREGAAIPGRELPVWQWSFFSNYVRLWRQISDLAPVKRSAGVDWQKEY